MTGGYCDHVNVIFGTWYHTQTSLLEQRLIQEACVIAFKYPENYRKSTKMLQNESNFQFGIGQELLQEKKDIPPFWLMKNLLMTLN